MEEGELVYILWEEIWRSMVVQITDAIHAKGSFIYLQMWALGRASDPNTLKKEGNHDLVSASDIPIQQGGIKPRPLTKSEIAEYVELYAKAAQNAVQGAGFDGVEIHR
jgi:NADPH2 dehydrogenase